MDKEESESTEDFIDKLLEQDHDFEDFDTDKELIDKEREKETLLKLEDDWDDDDAKDDLSLLLKKELENSSKKDGVGS